MTNSHPLSNTHSPASSGASTLPVPMSWLEHVNTQLATNETVLAWLEIDLDAQLRYAPGLIVLTTQRLIARSADDKLWQAHSNGAQA